MEYGGGMKSIAAEFWRLPIALKLVVISFAFFSLSNFWTTGIEIMKFTINIRSLISGIIFYNLAVGIINKSNTSRKWGIFFMFLSSLGWLSVLMISVFEDPDPAIGLQIQTPLTHTQEIASSGVFFILTVGLLFILLQPATKAFFTSQTNLEGLR